MYKQQSILLLLRKGIKGTVSYPSNTTVLIHNDGDRVTIPGFYIWKQLIPGEVISA